MFTDYLTQTIIIQTYTKTSNQFGGYAETWADSQTVNGLIDLQNGNENKISDKYVEKSTHVLFLETGITINNTNRIKQNNEVYRVLYVDQPFNRHQEIYLEKVGVDDE